MSDRVLRLFVTGRVQGVGYRAWAVRRGTELGLRGWVRNRADGSVEMVMAGAEDAVTAMVDACREGPRHARVLQVVSSEATDDGSTGFTAIPTV